MHPSIVDIGVEFKVTENQDHAAVFMLGSRHAGVQASLTCTQQGMWHTSCLSCDSEGNLMMTSNFSQWQGERHGCHEAVGEVYTDGLLPDNLKQSVRNSAIVRGLYYRSLENAWKKADQLVEKMALLLFNAGILSDEIRPSSFERSQDGHDGCFKSDCKKDC